ncbi:leucine-rich repeat domain-containing protein, partial [Chryseobacterium candidae]
MNEQALKKVQKQIKECVRGNFLHNRRSEPKFLDLSGLGLDSETLEVVMPEIISKLPDLDSLLLDYNELTSLPESIDKLRNLKALRLDENDLTSLPESIGNLRNLRELELNHNKLNSLPESIVNLTSLTKLFMSHNEIKDLPKDFKFDNFGMLEQIQFIDNPLSRKTKKSSEDFLRFWKTRETRFLNFLETIYPGKERNLQKLIGDSDLDYRIIINHGFDKNGNPNSVTLKKSHKNLMKEFMGSVPIDTDYEKNLYGDTAKMLIDNLHDRNINLEERNSIQSKIAASLGNGSAPVKDLLMRDKIEKMLQSRKELSKSDYLMIERHAIIEEMSKLNQLNGKKEAIYALADLIYSKNYVSNLAQGSGLKFGFRKTVYDEKDIEKIDLHMPKNHLVKPIESISPISENIDLGFKDLKSSVIQEFVKKFNDDSGPYVARYEGTDIYSLNAKKIKEITENYLFKLNLLTPELQKQITEESIKPRDGKYSSKPQNEIMDFVAVNQNSPKIEPESRGIRSFFKNPFRHAGVQAQSIVQRTTNLFKGKSPQPQAESHGEGSSLPASPVPLSETVVEVNKSTLRTADVKTQPE